MVLGHYWFWAIIGLGTLLVWGHYWFWDIIDFETLLILGYYWFWQYWFLNIIGFWTLFVFRHYWFWTLLGAHCIVWKECFLRVCRDPTVSVMGGTDRVHPLLDSGEDSWESPHSGTRPWSNFQAYRTLYHSILLSLERMLAWDSLSTIGFWTLLVFRHYWFLDTIGLGTLLFLGQYWFWDTIGLVILLVFGHYWFLDTVTLWQCNTVTM